MSALSSRGRSWFQALTGQPAQAAGSILTADAPLGGESARWIAVVPDPESRFPRAGRGEVGLVEGWTLAREVRAVLAADAAGPKRPIVAIVDVPSQAYGRLEELLGIHLACAAAVDAYAAARLAGHPVLALLVGGAMSGAFLAHGYQANRIVALDDPGVMVHAMGKAAAARVTRRTVAELDALAATVPPMSYAIGDYAGLGLVDVLLDGIDPDRPGPADIARVAETLARQAADARTAPADLSNRLGRSPARAATAAVRRRMAAQWPDPA